MKEIIKKDWEYTLYQDNEDNLILVVLCGSVALYEVSIQLNEDEKLKFEESRTEFLEELAEDIRTNTSKYEHRFVSLEQEN